MKMPKPRLVDQWHQELAQQIERLKTLSSWPGDDVSGRPLIELLSEVLGEFRVALSGHFSLEEQGGYMAEPLARAPHLQTSAELLLDQHETLLHRFMGLYRRCQRTVDDLEKFRCDVLQAVNDLREHESGENLLWQSSWMDDAAAHD